MSIPWGLPARELQIREDGCVCLCAVFPPIVPFITGFAKETEMHLWRGTSTRMCDYQAALSSIGSTGWLFRLVNT